MRAQSGTTGEGFVWPPAAGAFPVERLDDFLLWAAEAGASDVVLQAGSPALIKVDGVLRRAGGAELDGVALGHIAAALYDATAEGVLRSGAAVDCSHAVRRGRRGPARRFRVNLAPVQVEHGFAVCATLRVLPEAPPRLEELGIEAEIAGAWKAPRGLSLVTGVPGSGKSTLMAAGTRALLERGAGCVQSYESPIEFVFDGIGCTDPGRASLISASEVPRHFRSFAEGLRSSLRRAPEVVIVGEARDRETVEAALKAADFGIAVYATAHTVGVAQTVRRLLAEFPAGERAERGAALADLLHLVVTQVLVANPGGGRTALREWLTFTPALRAGLLEAPQESWPGLIGEELERTGNTLAAAADRARADGRIGAEAHRRLVAAHGGPGGGGESRGALGRGGLDDGG